MAWSLCYRDRRLCMLCCHDSCVMAMLCCCFLCMLCVVAMLQSQLTRAAGRWQQHKASVIQPRNRTLLSRTQTAVAELYYLRHMRSCAATAMGNKGGTPSPSTALQAFMSCTVYGSSQFASFLRHAGTSKHGYTECYQTSVQKHYRW